MSGTLVFFLLAYFGGLIYASVIAVKKGKTTMMIVGWLLFTPCIIIAACRIAKPNSSFAHENYGDFNPMKAKLAEMRFPKEAYLMKQLAQTANVTQL